MKIIFITSQSAGGSTVIGRIIPLAEEFSHFHETYVFLLKNRLSSNSSTDSFKINTRYTGFEPFTRSSKGKKRLSGLKLYSNLASIIIRTFIALISIHPDFIIISKPLPHNVLPAWLYSLINRKTKIISDVDDYELSANVLNSITARIPIHWSERQAGRISDTIITASPFLQNHFKFLTGKKNIFLIPTGCYPVTPPVPSTIKNSSSYNILYIGSLTSSSGHKIELLPPILKKILDKKISVTLHIAGSGDDEDQLKSLLKQLNINNHCQYHGHFEKKQLPKITKNINVIVDPIDSSVNARAKSSFRVCLALAYGIPVVTSNVGIRPHLVPPSFHNRFFAQPNDPSDYAEKIFFLLTNSLSEQEKSALIKHSHKYLWPQLASDYMKKINLSS